MFREKVQVFSRCLLGTWNLQKLIAFVLAVGPRTEETEGSEDFIEGN